MTAYFNRPDVQGAFHANSSGNELPYAWESCSSQVLYSRCTHACHPLCCLTTPGMHHLCPRVGCSKTPGPRPLGLWQGAQLPAYRCPYECCRVRNFTSREGGWILRDLCLAAICSCGGKHCPPRAQEHGRRPKECVCLCCRTDLLTSMLPTYRMLLEYDLSILVFSGDVDAIVPVSSQPAHAALCKLGPRPASWYRSRARLDMGTFAHGL